MKYLFALLFVWLTSTTWAQEVEKIGEPFIDQLETGDTMTIAIIRSGCLHFSTRSIIISKSEKGYVASNDTQSQMLSKKDVKLIRKFETTPIPVCPASMDDDVYLFTLGEKTREKRNECEDWKPHKRLVKKLDFSRPMGIPEIL